VLRHLGERLTPMKPGGIRTLIVFAAGVLVLAGALVAVLIDDSERSRVAVSGSVHASPGQPPQLSASRLRHITDRHWPESVARGAGKFAAPMSADTLRSYIQEADAIGTSRPNTGGRPGRLLEYDFGRIIGTTITGEKASRIRIVVSDKNQVVTAFPY
jgi:hypothetical protein